MSLFKKDKKKDEKKMFSWSGIKKQNVPYKDLAQSHRDALKIAIDESLRHENAVELGIDDEDDLEIETIGTAKTFPQKIANELKSTGKGEVKSDVLGSYTGTPVYGEQPEQDSDDL